MKHIEKSVISHQLSDFVQLSGSQNKAANKLNGVSAALISQALNNNWERISDDMWRRIEAQISITTNSGTTLVETDNKRYLDTVLKNAQDTSQTFAIVSPAGTGKTATVKEFVLQRKNAFHLECSDYWGRKRFLRELLQTMGREDNGTVDELMDEVLEGLQALKDPLIIIDEADSLKDGVLYFFKTIYNKLNGHCGLVLIATEVLKKKIHRGLRLQKKGYEEIYSRIGRRFLVLPGVSYTDVVAICGANGIEDLKTIKKIEADAQNDLRRVDRMIHAHWQNTNGSNG